MRIGFDIDDCLTKTTQQFCEYYNKIFDTKIEYEDLDAKSGKFEDTGLVTHEEGKLIKDYYKKDRIFKVIPPYEDALDKLKELNSIDKLFVTSRDDYDFDLIDTDTKYWFDSQGIENYKIIFSKEKSKIVNDNNLDLFLEDNLMFIDDLLENTNAKIFAPIRPWNQKYISNYPNVLFFNKWQEINFNMTDND